MPDDRLLGPDWPLRFVTNADGTVSYAQVIQDTDAEYRASAAVIIATPRGAHLGDPSFGVTSPVFDTAPVSGDRLAAEVMQSDPRLVVTAREAADTRTAAKRVLSAAVGRADTPIES